MVRGMAFFINIEKPLLKFFWSSSNESEIICLTE